MILSGGLSLFYRKQAVTAAIEIAAKACAVAPADVAAGKRKASIAFARQLSMYLCHVVADMSLRDVAEAFERDRTTVSHACHSIEDRRECPIFDRQVEHLEKHVRTRIRKIVAAATSAPPGGSIEKKHLRLSA